MVMKCPIKLQCLDTLLRYLAGGKKSLLGPKAGRPRSPATAMVRVVLTAPDGQPTLLTTANEGYLRGALVLGSSIRSLVHQLRNACNARW